MNMEKYGKAGKATDDNIRNTGKKRRFACPITKVIIRKQTQTQNMLLLSQGNIGYVNAPEYYAKHTLPLLSSMNIIIYFIYFRFVVSSIDVALEARRVLAYRKVGFCSLVMQPAM